MTVHVIATGGTISSHFDGAGWTNIGGVQLVDEAGPHEVAVTVDEVASGPSSSLSVDDMISIAQRVRQRLEAGEQGVLVSHGTDTLELTSFVTSLLLGTDASRRPVVFTGSMRVHSHVEPDGTRNLRDAIAVASSEQAVGRDVMVCLDGVLHAAHHVVKTNAMSLAAFTSAPFEPIGSIGSMDGATPVFDGEATYRPAATGFVMDVPLISCYPGMASDELARLSEGRRGVVVEVFGNLNVPTQLWEPIHRAWNDGVLIVLASRPFTHATADDGLRLLGAVGAGGLTAQKARLATMAALGTCDDRDGAVAFLHQHSLPYDAQDRGTG